MDISDRLAKLEDQLKLVEAYSVQGFWTALDRAYELSLPHRELRCIICDHAASRDGFRVLTDRCQFGGGKLERYHCPKCDAIFGAQKYLDLSEDFVSSDYALLYSRYSESDSTPNEVRTFHALAPRPDGVYLDWGCGGAWSKTVQTLRDSGFDVWGYEPTIADSSGFIVKNRDELSTKFDGIFSNNVIEHFRDPVAAFNDLKTLLKPGASMAHSSPCYEYNYAYTRFHTIFLLGRSPHVLAERTGFKAQRAESEGEYINYVYTLC